jgi:hypothetical protein
MGERKNGEKEGFGIQKWKDGAVYQGLFNNNRANGLGIFKHSDGDEFKGEFVNDRAFGYGMYKHSNGATYEGFWVDDCQNGIGEEKWSDNSEYTGLYTKGKKQGLGIYLFNYLGTYIWSDRSRYEGEWYENCLHGFVIITFIFRAHIILMMTEFTVVSGNIILCMVMVNLNGKMEKNISDIMYMIKKKDSVSITGQVPIEFTLASGKVANRMEWVNILILNWSVMVFGKMEKG